MKKRQTKRFSVTRQIIKEWYQEMYGLNVGNPDPDVIPAIRRIRNQAYKELREG